MNDNEEKNPIKCSGSVFIAAINYVETKGFAKWKTPRLPKKKKSAYEYFRGYEKSENENAWLFKTRKTDRENNEYFKEVLEDKSDRTIRFCAEPLSRHVGRGSAKHKK